MTCTVPTDDLPCVDVNKLCFADDMHCVDVNKLCFADDMHCAR